VPKLVAWGANVALVLAAVVVWIAFGETLSRAKPVPVGNVPAPTGVVWHGRVYQSEQRLRVELALEGRHWATWAHNHPHAAALLRSRPGSSGSGRSAERT
jgi:hypothetical protein